ncbi:MAG: type II secretion system protein [Candidatus Taylorbacteria bacterium]|nr:type II secretion system protein [Candidatus Taylorbacteria bacterium]
MFPDRNKGFTLIELMVVISIIGMLSSVIIVSLNNARQRALKVKAQQEILQIVRAADLARLLNDTTLIGITENPAKCSVCGGEAAMVTSLTNISTKSGIPGLQNIRKDPWGGVYQLDENEGEFDNSPPGSHDCRRDWILPSLNRPDDSTVYSLEYQTTYCKANPVGTAGWGSPPSGNPW